MTQVSLFVDHIPFCCNLVFADGGLVTSCVTLLLKIFASWSLHWRNAPFLFAGMPLAQAVAILQKHCRIIKNVQVLYSEQVSSAWAGQEMHSWWIERCFVLMYTLCELWGCLKWNYTKLLPPHERCSFSKFHVRCNNPQHSSTVI